MGVAKGLALLLGFIIWCAPLGAEDKKAPEFILYPKLNHKILLKELRAGNHDEKGKNEYYFKAKVLAVLKDPDERAKGTEARQKLTKEFEAFGNLALPSLSVWENDQETSFAVPGEDLRVLTAEAMQQWKQPEEKIAIMVLVEMYEKAKKFVFFGNDTLVGIKKYYVIPETMPHQAPLKEKELVIKDDQGTFVKLAIEYEQNQQAQQKTTASAP